MNAKLSPTPRMLKVREVAEILAISERQVFRVIARGDLPAHRFDRTVRISERDLRGYIASRLEN